MAMTKKRKKRKKSDRVVWSRHAATLNSNIIIAVLARSQREEEQICECQAAARFGQLQIQWKSGWAGWPRQAAAASSSDIGGALLSNRRKSKQGQQGQTYTELEQQCLTSGRHTLPARKRERERAIQLLSPAIEAAEAKRVKSAGNESNRFENVNRCIQ